MAGSNLPVVHSKCMTTEQLVAQFKGMGGTVTKCRRGKRTITEAQFTRRERDDIGSVGYFQR